MVIYLCDLDLEIDSGLQKYGTHGSTMYLCAQHQMEMSFGNRVLKMPQTPARASTPMADAPSTVTEVSGNPSNGPMKSLKKLSRLATISSPRYLPSKSNKTRCFSNVRILPPTHKQYLAEIRRQTEQTK